MHRYTGWYQYQCTLVLSISVVGISKISCTLGISETEKLKSLPPIKWRLFYHLCNKLQVSDLSMRMCVHGMSDNQYCTYVDIGIGRYIRSFILGIVSIRKSDDGNL